jgi:hypothetical protein
MDLNAFCDSHLPSGCLFRMMPQITYNKAYKASGEGLFSWIKVPEWLLCHVKA